MNNEFKRMQKLAGILTEGYQGTDYESSEDMALDMVKTGAGMPGTGLPEMKTKMTKSEAKKMIKDAILAEMSHNPEDYVAFVMQNIGDESTPVTLTHGFDRYDEKKYKTTLGKALTFIEKNADASAIENGDVTVDGGPGLVRITIGDQEFDIQSSAEKVTEAKKDEEVPEEEVEVSDEETVEEPAPEMDMVDADMEGGLDMDAGSDEAKNAFDELTDAYRSAKELGDEKLIRQLANTITYFNKNIILK